ncbi:MAG: hypothetical protein IPJ23_05940 [Ignavibacteriales bacterium]|nr:hypothetical protein [Ignavibacteriales bacterium]
MNNLEKYRFTDFTLEKYKEFLLLALDNFSFINFNDNLEKKSIILRHDIEFSLPIAYEMAKIENELGIKSTYFLQLHCDFYNAIDKDSYNIINEIVKLGHSLGLHFDAHFWNVQNEEQLENYLIIDKRVLETYFKIKLNVFSFHNTNKFILSCEKDKYCDMINAYSKYFKEKIGYCSDSTGYWRFEILPHRLSEAKDDYLQILIHDGMWQNEVLPPRRRIYKVIDDRANYLKKFYDETLVKFGAKNIDWDEIL